MTYLEIILGWSCQGCQLRRQGSTWGIHQIWFHPVHVTDSSMPGSVVQSSAERHHHAGTILSLSTYIGKSKYFISFSIVAPSNWLAIYLYILLPHNSLFITYQVCNTFPIVTHHTGPPTRYVKLRVAHAPRMPGTYSPPPTSKETAS